MFYSQFILAKKGPLGTIWIAAHLERKLRKNQVADTDIGVSVDSILFPDVPIALRLSSHLLLGVVRIYSRKVNYLFDDCSEALLKIKQAFRSTAVDLPPEESTAPYHSITLPETFDLEDFELPDNDMYQGNYVDHHISTREQITLQDTMDGVVYSTSQFGLDERFGDGDTSQVGLDLEEDLYLDKAEATGQDEVPENDAQASVSTPYPDTYASPGRMSGSSGDMDGTTDKMLDLADDFDAVDYADAPCTPGLVEVPNVNSVKEGLACDDHLEPEEHNLRELMEKTDNKTSESDFNHQEDAMELSLGDIVKTDNKTSESDFNHQEDAMELSLGDVEKTNNKTSESDFTHQEDAMDLSLGDVVKTNNRTSESDFTHHENAMELSSGDVVKTNNTTSESDFTHQENAIELSLGDAVNHDTVVSTPAENNSLSGELEIYQAAPEGEFLCTAATAEHIPADQSVCTVGELDKFEDRSQVVSCNNEQTMSSIDQINGEHEVFGVRLQETDNVKIGCDFEVPHSNGNATLVNAFQSLELFSAQECVNVEAQDCQGLVDREIQNDYDKDNAQTVSTFSGFLRPCSSQPSQLNGSSPVNSSFVAPELQSVDAENSAQREEGRVLENSTKVQGEECHVFEGIQSEKIRMSEPTLNGAILEDGGKQDGQLDYAIYKDNHSENLITSMPFEFPAPEKLLSAPQSLLHQPRDLLIETPYKGVQEEGDGSEAGTRITGQKRSFAETSSTVPSLNLADSFGVARSMGTVGSIPGDDDLLSSILVGRNLSVMKIKPSPPAPEVRPSKRARAAPRAKSASRPSAVKRKLVIDDSMVLHGDTIRQQLTSTEHIRRQRKKAPCTQTEILMIQRQFLEDEIYSEPVLTGMSAELTLLHSKAFDLSRFRVCVNDNNNQASFELVNAENSARRNDNEGREMEGGMGTVTSRNDADGQPFPVQNANQQAEDHFGSYNINFPDHRNYIAVEMDFRSPVHDNLGELAEMEGYRANFDAAVASNSTFMGVEMLQSEQVSGQIPEMPIDNLSADKVDIQPTEEVPFLKDTMEKLQSEQVLGQISEMPTDNLSADRIDIQLQSEVSGEKISERPTDNLPADKIDIQLNEEVPFLKDTMETLLSEQVSGPISEMPTDNLSADKIDIQLNEEVPFLKDTMEMLQSEQVPGQISELPTDNLSADKIDIQLNEQVSLKDTSTIVGVDATEAVDLSVEKIVSDRTESRTEKEIPLEETKISASDELLDGSAPNDNVDASLANVSSLNGGFDNITSVNVEQGLEDIENDKDGVRNEDMGPVTSSVCIDDKDQNPDPLCDDESRMDPTFSVGLEGDLGTASINHGDHFTGQESDHQNFMDTQNTLHQVTAGDYDDIHGDPFANDTEFLNVDDDEVDDDDDEGGMPNTEDARLLENTGWSSRTRAVARYLQTLFDKEAEHGRKVLSMENLLAGKTRKEASRMFFETLVLKTRDYIQVEQLESFNNISIKPRSKLMKSDF